MRVRGQLLTRLAAIGVTVAGALGGEPLDLIPAESLLCWHARPYPDAPPPSDEQSALTTLVDLGTRLSGQPLDTRMRLTIRLAETFGTLISYPHAVALIDAKAVDAGGGGKRVDQLELVLVVDTAGRHDRFRRIIQKTMNELTDSGQAALVAQEADGFRYQELVDQRLPAWCAVAWGAIGDSFVITLGRGVWPRIARLARGGGAALGRDAWLAEARAEDAQRALIEIYVAVAAIRSRLDPFVDGRASDFFGAWHAAHIERVHWTLGFVDRAMFCKSFAQVAGRTQRRVWADPAEDDPKWMGTIPPAARYAIFRIPVAELMPRFLNGLAATRGRETHREILAIWEKIQREVGFDPQGGFLDRLGTHVILHNDPPHPLRLPLAFTALVEIRDDPQRVRATVDRMSTAWQNHMRVQSELAPVPNALQIQHDSDGVWYMQFGPLAGPAWTTTERFLVACWSPTALREYLRRAGDAVGTHR